MEIENSFMLLKFLKEQDLLPQLILSSKSNVEVENPKNWWWQNALSFEVVVGTILAQNTRWNQVEITLQNLRKAELLNVESLGNIPIEILQDFIKNVGFFRQKALRIQKLCQNILRDFGDYSTFCAEVSRHWLLEQKGVGLESCDSILNYALGRDVIVVDSYSVRLLGSFGYCLESYEEVREWLRSGVVEHYEDVCELYGFEIPLSLVFARFHGKIVEYSKNNRISFY